MVCGIVRVSMKGGSNPVQAVCWRKKVCSSSRKSLEDWLEQKQVEIDWSETWYL